ncbi:MAG: tRNA preQ1(34) S-adenosylmethionine ribosyltransferase-isomerase QueA, partial [Chloroflexi bacterium]|nr:tRNA preQ1(34) S-adenosylmethionine ribosyltransferase-isomerase QueA [Chloroflexota bacterium]
MLTKDFDYDLPKERIAQWPAPEREQSRLLVLHRSDGRIEHRRFPDLLEHLSSGDALVLNDSRVIPARLRGHKPDSGGLVEILLLEENGLNDWWAMLRPGKRVRAGTRIIFRNAAEEPPAVQAVVREKNRQGHCRLEFCGLCNISDALAKIGEVPLPPYIERVPNTGNVNDEERYQTVYAHPPGSVAAPTAGLHFTHEMLGKIRSRGVRICPVTLHVGLGTFAPVKAAKLEEHVMHEERYEISAETAQVVNETKSAGGRVLAVGTTAVRVLETVAQLHRGNLAAGAGRTRTFIYPPYDFKVADALLTNFHLPQSTLLML